MNEDGSDCESNKGEDACFRAYITACEPSATVSNRGIR